MQWEYLGSPLPATSEDEIACKCCANSKVLKGDWDGSRLRCHQSVDELALAVKTRGSLEERALAVKTLGSLVNSLAFAV